MSADATVRARVGGIPVPEFTDTPAVQAPPLSEAKVAVVTTAGLKPSGDLELWPLTDRGFTVLPRGSHEVQLAHFSPNFDRVGIAADLNVAYPVDRLEEMVAGGEIGSLSEINLSFMGAEMDATFATILLDTGPAAAQLLLEHEVDVVLLTPV